MFKCESEFTAAVKERNATMIEEVENAGIEINYFGYYNHYKNLCNPNVYCAALGIKPMNAEEAFEKENLEISGWLELVISNM